MAVGNRAMAGAGGDNSTVIRHFMCSTTFHGLHYVSDVKGQPLRRFLWMLAVLAAFTVLAIIIVANSLLFYRYPKTLAVNIQYGQHVPFPAVTICNLNMIRSSVAQKRDLYDSLRRDFLRFRTNSPRKDEGEEGTFYGYINVSVVGEVTALSPPVSGVTLSVCQQLCVGRQDVACNSILYDYNHGQCTLSQAILSSSTVTFIHQDNVHYLEYIRPESTLDMRCMFEAGLCHLHHSGDEHAVWRRTLRSENGYFTGPRGDHTSQQGYYMYVSIGEGEVAGIASSLITARSSQRCLEFYYHMYGRNVGEVRLNLHHADGVKEIIWRIKGNQGAVWYRAFIPVHSEVYRLELEGTGRAGHEDYIAIDDLRLAECSSFKTNCQRYADGSDYVGNVSVSSTGTSCVMWSQVSSPLNHLHFPYYSIDEAANYCRNPDGSHSPWCYVHLAGAREFCDIPFCACADSEFLCSNGRCVTADRLCDGGNDCGNMEDETLKTCAVSVGCDFEQAFMCGYTVNQKSQVFTWRRQQGQTRSPDTGPILDYTEDAATGSYMHVDATFGSQGDWATLMSPFVYNVSDVMPGCLQFAYHMYGQHIGSLHVLLLGGGEVYRLYNLPEISEDEWVSQSLTLNHSDLLSITTSLQLAFMVVRGDGTLGDIAIDGVRLETGTVCQAHLAGCPSGQYQCRNGRCIGQRGVCDGEDDCMDRSDEAHVCASLACDFERGSKCGYTESVTDYQQFERRRRPESQTRILAPDYQARLLTDEYYLYWSMDRYGLSGVSHRLTSPWWHVTSDVICLTFLRQAFSGSGGVLQVYIEEVEGAERLMKTYPQDKTQTWYMEEINIIVSSSKLRVIFEATSTYIGSNVGIDNINYLHEPCNTTVASVNCSFDETYICGYSVSVYSDYHWTRQLSDDRWYVIGVDHEAKHGGNTTHLTSPLTLLTHPHCLHFTYKMDGLKPDKFSLHLKQAGYYRQVWWVTGYQGETWRDVELDVEGGEYQLVFESIRGYEDTNNLQLDEVYLTPGPCNISTCDSNTSFSCNNGFCVALSVVCDGWDDCRDMSDELICSDSCLTGRGEFYNGRVNVTIDGQTCLLWSALPESLPLRVFPDRDERGRRNYCRNPGGGLDGPWCYTSLAGDWSYCPVTRCPCRENQIECRNGRCVPRAAQCNGVNDCGDNSDERDNCTGSISCDFDEPYMCGYQIDQQNYPYIWHRDAWNLATGDYYLYAYGYNGIAKSGVKCRLISVQVNISRPHCLGLEFKYGYALSENFRIYLRYVDGIYRQLVNVPTLIRYSYQDLNYTLQPGVFQVVFEAESHQDSVYIYSVLLSQGWCAGSCNTCSNGVCIDESLYCNGVDNCGDGSDETDRMCDQSCSRSLKGEYYMGFINHTVSGAACEPWSNYSSGLHITSLPHSTLADAGNYCRNPDNAERVWCFVDGGKRKEFCHVPRCPGFAGCSRRSDFQCNNGSCIEAARICDGTSDCMDPEDEISPCYLTKTEKLQKECRITLGGEEYRGGVNMTRTGQPCIYWTDDHRADLTPTDHGQSVLEENYCRNPDLNDRPWCYTGQTGDDWNYCNVPKCDCWMGNFDLPYIGYKNITPNGVACLPWASFGASVRDDFERLSDEDVEEAGNYCRFLNWHTPFCYTATNRVWEECDVDVCSGIAGETRGISCQFESGYMCGYTTSGSGEEEEEGEEGKSVRWVRMGFPLPFNSPLFPQQLGTKTDICTHNATRGADYQGQTSVTWSGISCQRWDAKFPHTQNSYDDEHFPGGNKTLAQNYCRNPSLQETRMWCYTTDRDVRWEFCDVLPCQESMMLAMPGSGPGEAEFFSPYNHFPPGQVWCLSFRILMPESTLPQHLSLLIQGIDGSMKQVWREQASPGFTWDLVQLEIKHLNGRHRLIFKIQDGGGYLGSVLDNVDLSKGACSKLTGCLSGEFRCDNGRCLDESKVCDGFDDCLDNSDESGTGCECEQFLCDDGRCISGFLVNNGDHDCLNGEDEGVVNLGKMKTPNMVEDKRETMKKTRLEKDYINYTIPDLSGPLTKQFLRDAAHRKDDFIHECLWENQPCEEAAISETFTDYGLCYSFNKGNNYKAKNAGAHSGLRLILNVETYEAMERIEAVSGVKAHVHDPDTLPALGEQGFYLATGMDYSLEVDLIKTHKLHEPWGDCVDEHPLRFYTRYNRPNCLLECSTNWTLEMCNCTAPHMPTPRHQHGSSLCSLRQYMDCYLFLRFYNQGSSCDCPETCHETYYGRKLSHGKLDLTFINDSKRLQRKVKRAEITNDLRNPRLYYHTLNSLYNITRLLHGVLQLTDGLWFTHTPPKSHNRWIYNIELGLKKLVNIYERSYTQIYEKVKEPLLSKLQDIVIVKKDILLYQKELIYWEHRMLLYKSRDIIDKSVNESMNGTMWSKEGTTIILIVKQISAQFEGLKDLYQRNVSQNVDISKAFDGVKHACDVLYDISTHSEDLDPYQVEHQLKSINVAVRGLLRVLGTECSEVKSIVRSLDDLHPDVTVWTLFRQMERLSDDLRVREFRTSLVHLNKMHHELVQSFQAEYDKKCLDTDLIDGRMLPLMRVNIKQALSRIIHQFLAPYQLQQIHLVTNLTTNYETLIRTLRRMRGFLPQRLLHQTLVGLEVWKRTLIDISPREITSINQLQPYSRIKAYVMKDEQELAAIINEHMTVYTEPIVRAFETYWRQVYQYDHDLQVVDKELSHITRDFIHRVTLHQQFISKNFVKLDVYFASLSRSDVSEAEGLSRSELISSIGGFMGLLIGGSLISACEILDLIITLIIGKHWVKP